MWVPLSHEIKCMKNFQRYKLLTWKVSTNMHVWPWLYVYQTSTWVDYVTVSLFQKVFLIQAKWVLSIPCIAIVLHSNTCNTISYISYIQSQYLSVNKHIKFISTDAITRNFSCTDVNNNNLQLSLGYWSWAKCCIILLTNMKG